ncbi:hypothetical protein [Sporolituus thermophilus]|uniref:Uncharacterized protein n=1 Tax=Sporolituus thermophilus DSM 23256 TaxID=1123285 RepID=A0A1G7P5E9_9FIRM|nr:hypothetical protein [Sporolituus thermophilus]SDF81483.1 hypothetical protein SAMN05660235_02834 [Sporolituus thermophilus DSM 23256]
MRKWRERKPLAMDVDHMRLLHQEAIEQLELLHTALDAMEQATGTMRDNLMEMVENHWHAYLDVMHMITMHDDAMANAMNKYGMKMRDADDLEDADCQFDLSAVLLTFLLLALIRRHRRMYYLWGLRGSPMSDYWKESMAMERDHMANLIAMMQRAL